MPPKFIFVSVYWITFVYIVVHEKNVSAILTSTDEKGQTFSQLSRFCYDFGEISNFVCTGCILLSDDIPKQKFYESSV